MNIYDSENREKIVATTTHRSRNLDLWDGNNYCRGTGNHLGLYRITRGKYAGRYILIRTTEWVGCDNFAHLISDEQALQEWLAGEQPDGFPELEKQAVEMEV